MNRKEFEALGIKQKAVEQKQKSFLLDKAWTVVRLDGRAFHSFAKSLAKPFDENLSTVMIETTKHLVEVFHASIGYTQSDEITIVFNPSKLLMFNGSRDKLVSTIASEASVFFRIIAQKSLPQKNDKIATFDCRIVQFTDINDVVENLLWRETDATRNSLSMVAQSLFSSKELHGKGFKDKHDLLHSKGVNWNDFSAHYKRGSYFARESVTVTLTKEQLDKIPEKHRPISNEVVRTIVNPVKLLVENPLETVIASVELLTQLKDLMVK